MKASDRAGALTRQLLAFSRQQVLAPKVLNLNTIVLNMHNLLRRLLGEDVDLQTVLDPELGHVKADPSQIEQVLMNLAVNARDAMPMGGRLTVETANVELTEDWGRDIINAKPGPYVMIAMTDSGAGMDEATKARVFEPFFTTKEQGKGTGLGLSTAYGIVKQSDGYISVYSEVGIGSTFKVYLPRMDSAREVIATPACRRQQRIAAPKPCCWWKTKRACENWCAASSDARATRCWKPTSGEEALEMVHDHRGKIDLLLSDVVLVGMSGRELSERMRIQMPTLKVIYMSGYTDDAIVRHGVLTESAEFLQKPFSSDNLLRKVRAVLRKAAEHSSRTTVRSISARDVLFLRLRLVPFREVSRHRSRWMPSRVREHGREASVPDDFGRGIRGAAMHDLGEDFIGSGEQDQEFRFGGQGLLLRSSSTAGSVHRWGARSSSSSGKKATYGRSSSRL